MTRKIEVPIHNAYNYLHAHAISLISSVDKEGNPNVAPYGEYMVFNAFNADPPIVLFGPTIERKTYKNILETKDFVANVPHEGLINQINVIAKDYDSSINKFKRSGLTPIPSLKVKSPSVKECKIHYECRLLRVEYFGKNKALIFGEIVAITLDEELARLSEIDRIETMRLILYGSFKKNGKSFGKYYSLGGSIGTHNL
jgi:flavin reductase (DIM6/NTAB) family NADH-FMN oxidoreductase RutF